MLKAFLVILGLVVMLVESGMLIYTSTALAAKDETIELLKEGQQLLTQQLDIQNKLEKKADQVCEMQFKLGIAYRDVLIKLTRDLGLTGRRDNAWVALLSATGKALPPL